MSSIGGSTDDGAVVKDADADDGPASSIPPKSNDVDDVERLRARKCEEDGPRIFSFDFDPARAVAVLCRATGGKESLLKSRFEPKNFLFLFLRRSAGETDPASSGKNDFFSFFFYTERLPFVVESFPEDRAPLANFLEGSSPKDRGFLIRTTRERGGKTEKNLLTRKNVSLFFYSKSSLASS